MALSNKQSVIEEVLVLSRNLRQLYDELRKMYESLLISVSMELVDEVKAEEVLSNKVNAELDNIIRRIEDIKRKLLTSPTER